MTRALTQASFVKWVHVIKWVVGRSQPPPARFGLLGATDFGWRQPDLGAQAKLTGWLDPVTADWT